MVDVVANRPSVPEQTRVLPHVKKTFASVSSPKSQSEPSPALVKKREKLHQQIEQLSGVVTKKNDGFQSDMQAIVDAQKAGLFAAKVCKLVDSVEKYGVTDEDKNLLRTSLATIEKALTKIKSTEKIKIAELSDENGRTRLHTLCGQEFGLVPPEHLKEAAEFIGTHSDAVIMHRDVEGFTALEHACLAGNPEFLKLFCDAGKAALFGKKDPDGDMPLHILCTGMTGGNIGPRHIEAAKILVGNMTKEQLKAKNNANETAHALIMKPLSEVIEALKKATAAYEKEASVRPATMDERALLQYERGLSALAAIQSDLVGQMISLREVADLIEKSIK